MAITVQKVLDPTRKERCRNQDIEGDTYFVPRHIVRLDKPGTHGWQVRFSKPSKFFNDFDRSPGTSLREAKNYLKSVYKPVPYNTRRGHKLQGRGVAGIRLFMNEKQHWYVEATPPQHGFSPKRFYVGTNKTVTTEKISEGYEKAKAQRNKWLETLPVPTR